MINIPRYAFTDLKKWITYTRFRPKTGYITCYCSASGVPFGSGKTVSALNEIFKIVDRYNGKHGVKVVVWSNIHIDINCDFYEISNLQDFVDGVESNKNPDVYNILFIDEMAAEFNNRNFAKNFTPDFLAKLVTCRHYNSMIFYTSQNYYMVDKVFRDLTTHIFTCRKLWRFFFHKKYLPEDMEALHNAQYIKPISRSFFFATDEIFDRYDTFARFKAMDKAIRDGDYKTSEEISSVYRESSGPIQSPNRLTRLGERRYRRGTP